MKVRNALVLTASLLATAAASAGQDTTAQYLADHGFIDRDAGSVEIVDRRAVEAGDPATRYLVDSGFVEGPTTAAEARRPRVAERSQVERILIDWGFRS